MEDYQTTALWRTAFGEFHRSNKGGAAACDDLLTALRTLESRIAPILERIPESCKELTIHDISHVHQLWSVASQICGPDYPINPLEGFVLGAAFLIHDAGLTAAAYPGGLNALKETSYYKDRVGALLRSQNEYAAPSADAISNAPDSISERALFDTLRAVHAKQAESLLETSKQHPLTGQPYSLFPDPELFLDCGEIIGMVAASHHWPIDKVDSKFADPRTAPARFPSWPIDMVKLACILRTADASAIDERRARVMPLLLADPRGVSRDHWRFQMNINPGECRDDAIVFHSKIPFSRDLMPAWWVAFDAIKIADQELRSTDQLLHSRSLSSAHRTLRRFAAHRVDGANEPERLKTLVRVSGWTPVDTSIRIDNPLALVEKLGGRHLYGDDHAAPLREIIQNAADAIRARRSRLGGFDSTVPYPGQIDISIRADIKDDRIQECVLTVSDNGVGMPQDVLTGALLDFGRSFWGTEEAATRYPGLASDHRFQPTGRFGIGFYAIFMLADDVRVISRSWTEGVSAIKTLHFRSGIRGRPELRDYNEGEDGRVSLQHSTVIEARLNKLNWPINFAALSAHTSDQRIRDHVHFWELFQRTATQLVFALDVNCRLSINGGPDVRLNQADTLTRPATDFAKGYNQSFADEDSRSKYDDEEIGRIGLIDDENGNIHSRGVVNVDTFRSGVIHIGGLTVFGAADQVIKGVVAYAPGTASRTIGRRTASLDRLHRWGNEQLASVVAANILPTTKFASIVNLVNINIDVTGHALLTRDDIVTPVTEIVGDLPPKAKLFVSIQQSHRSVPFSLSNFSIHFWRFDDLKNQTHDVRIGTMLFGSGDRYNQIQGPFDAPTNANSGYAVLIRTIRDAGYTLSISGPSRVPLGSYFGPDGGHGQLADRNLVEGATVEDYGIEISCHRDVA